MVVVALVEAVFLKLNPAHQIQIRRNQAQLSVLEPPAVQVVKVAEGVMLVM